MIVTTTPAVEGRKIVAYKGIVFGEVVSGVNFIKDMFSSITDMIGGRSGTYEKELQEAREKALAEMSERAAKLGADAVVAKVVRVAELEVGFHSVVTLLLKHIGFQLVHQSDAASFLLH